MTEKRNDKQLKTEFQQLRETETRAAPNFRQLLASASRTEPTRHFRPALPFATAAALLIVAIAVFLGNGRDQSLPELTESAPITQEEMNLVAALEMPTDFLLDSPWYELAGTTPDFDFEFPQYDMPEDLSDEI